jgi:hypothetical protein
MDPGLESMAGFQTKCIRSGEVKKQEMDQLRCKKSGMDHTPESPLIAWRAGRFAGFEVNRTHSA